MVAPRGPSGIWPIAASCRLESDEVEPGCHQHRREGSRKTVVAPSNRRGFPRQLLGADRCGAQRRDPEAMARFPRLPGCLDPKIEASKRRCLSSCPIPRRGPCRATGEASHRHLSPEAEAPIRRLEPGSPTCSRRCWPWFRTHQMSVAIRAPDPPPASAPSTLVASSVGFLPGARSAPCGLADHTLRPPLHDGQALFPCPQGCPPTFSVLPRFMPLVHRSMHSPSTDRGGSPTG